jgi:hypothetical protein
VLLAVPQIAHGWSCPGTPLRDYWLVGAIALTGGYLGLMVLAASLVHLDEIRDRIGVICPCLGLIQSSSNSPSAMTTTRRPCAERVAFRYSTPKRAKRSGVLNDNGRDTGVGK